MVGTAETCGRPNGLTLGHVPPLFQSGDIDRGDPQSEPEPTLSADRA